MTVTPDEMDFIRFSLSKRASARVTAWSGRQSCYPSRDPSSKPISSHLPAQEKITYSTTIEEGEGDRGFREGKAGMEVVAGLERLHMYIPTG